MAKRRIKIKRVPETTETITKGIVNFLLNEGHSASRVNVQGQFDGELTIWRRSGSRKGFADIVASLLPYGKFCAIEIKFNKDTQSRDQVEFMNEVRYSGGIYLDIKTYSEFINWYTETWSPIIEKWKKRKI